MQLLYIPICNSIDYEIEPVSNETQEKTQLEQMKEDLLKASQTLTRACEIRLSSYTDLDLKEIRTLSQIILDLQNTYFGKPEVVVNNYQQNISTNQLNFFKSILKDEV